MGNAVVNVNGKDREFRFIKVNQEIRMEADVVYAKVFHECLDNGLPLRAQIERKLESSGLVDNDLGSKTHDVRQKLNEHQKLLYSAKNADGSKMTREQGRDIALAMVDLREKLSSMGNDFADVYSHSAESKANTKQLLYFVYATTIDADTGKRYWNSFKEFEEDDQSPVIPLATKSLLANFAGIDKDFEKKYPENAWLIRMGYMNDRLQLVDPEGRVIDREGHLLNKDGRFIDAEGRFVDRSGNLIDEQGNLIVEDNWE